MADAVMLYGDLTAGATISATNVIASLPAANMAHPHLSRVTRFSTASTVIDIDLLTARAARGVFLAGLTGAATIALVAGTTSGASDVFDGTGLVTASSADQGYAILPSAATARHWRLTVTGTTEIGRLLLGPAVAVSRNIGYPLTLARQPRNRVIEGYGGERTVDRRPDIREASFGWVDAGITAADVVTLGEFDAAVSGAQAALIPDPADASLGAPMALLGWVDEIGDATFSDVGRWRKSYRIRA